MTNSWTHCYLDCPLEGRWSLGYGHAASRSLVDFESAAGASLLFPAPTASDAPDVASIAHSAAIAAPTAFVNTAEAIAHTDLACVAAAAPGRVCVLACVAVPRCVAFPASPSSDAAFAPAIVVVLAAAHCTSFEN